MAGRGFSYPVLFGDEKSDVRATVERRLRYVSTFMNSYIATYDTDTRDLRIRDEGGVMAGTGFTPTDNLHLTTKAYVDNAVSGTGGGGGTILAAGTSTTNGITLTTSEVEYGTVTVSGLGASATIYVDVTVSLQGTAFSPGQYGGIKLALDGSGQGTYAYHHAQSSNLSIVKRNVVASTADSSGEITLGVIAFTGSGSTANNSVELAYIVYSR